MVSGAYKFLVGSDIGNAMLHILFFRYFAKVFPFREAVQTDSLPS